MSDEVPPGWYPDPAGGDGERWWDGNSWTDHARSGSGTVPPTAPVADAQSKPRRGRWMIPAVAVLALVVLGGGAAGWWLLDGELSGAAGDVADAEDETAQLRAQLAERESELEEREAMLAERDDEVASRDEEIADLRAELEQAREELDQTAAQETTGGDGDIVAGDFRFSQIEVRSDFVDDFEIRARMTNEGSVTRDYVSISATIFAADGRILAVLDGFESRISPGQSTTVTLTGFDDYTPNWDHLEIEVEY